MLNPLKKTLRKRKTNTVAAGCVANRFIGLRLELELDRAWEGGTWELYFAGLSAINFALATIASVRLIDFEYKLCKFICAIR